MKKIASAFYAIAQIADLQVVRIVIAPDETETSPGGCSALE
jgi:hypothetical protein